MVKSSVWRALLRSDWRMVINLLGMDSAGRVNRIRGALAAILSFSFTLGSGWLVVHFLLQLIVSYFGSEAVNVFLAVTGTVYLLTCFGNPQSTHKTLFPPYTITLFATQPIPARDVVIWRMLSFLSIIGIIQSGLILPIIFKTGAFHQLTLSGYLYLGGNIFLLVVFCFLVKLLMASLHVGRHRFTLHLFLVILTLGTLMRIYFLIFRPGKFIWQPGEFPVLSLLAWQQVDGGQIVLAPTILMISLLVAAFFNVRANKKPAVYLEEAVTANENEASVRISRLDWPHQSSRWHVISRLEIVCVLRNYRLLSGIIVFPAVVGLLMGAACRAEPTWVNFLAAILAGCWAVFSSVVKQLVVVNRDFETLLLSHPLRRRDIILGRALAAMLLGLPIILLWIGLITLMTSFRFNLQIIFTIMVTGFFAILITITLNLALSYRFFRWFAGNTFSDAMIGQMAGICALFIISLPGLILGRFIFTSNGVWLVIWSACGVVLAIGGTIVLLKTSEIFARCYLI